MGVLLWIIVIGFIAGVIARLLMPGPNTPKGFVVTTIIGVAGAVLASIVGDLTDSEAELTDRLLSVEPGGECTIYFDSPGGSPYCAVSLMTLIKLRGVRATGIVTGECSSATLWPFAACVRRIVTPFSVMLFHPMRWQSEENVGLAEAAEWARHFGQLELDGLETRYRLAELLAVLGICDRGVQGALGDADSLCADRGAGVVESLQRGL